MADYALYPGAWSGEQVDEAVGRALSGGELDQEIAAIRAAVGSPLVANTAAAMTDTNKVYVYTGTEAGYTAGHWYYWNGSAWADGGVYNAVAVDDELSDSSVNAVQNKVITAALADLDEMAASKLDADGTAQQAAALTTNQGYTDTAPYTYRRAGAGHAGTRMRNKSIVGVTLAWNQLIPDPTFADNSKWVFNSVGGSATVSDNVCDITISTPATLARIGTNPNFAVKAGHKYLFAIDAKGDSSIVHIPWNNGWVTGSPTALSASWQTLAWIGRSNANGTGADFPYCFNTSGASVGDVLSLRNAWAIDLTLALGSAIADKAYALESATAGSGIAWLRSYGLFPAGQSFAYDAGSLESVCVSAHKTYDADDTLIGDYPIDDIEMRGILKLDGDNIVADGDVYLPSGAVTRWYGIRAYQAGDESLADAVTDGTNTVYKLAEPTTETAAPYAEIEVTDKNGTEAFVDALVAAGTRDVAVPVGGERLYMRDLVGVVEDIPEAPSADGSYRLAVTVSGGVASYEWVSA